MKPIVESLRKSVQDMLQQQREIINEVEVALKAGDAVRLNTSFMRLAMVVQRMKPIQEALEVVVGLD